MINFIILMPTYLIFFLAHIVEVIGAIHTLRRCISITLFFTLLCIFPTYLITPGHLWFVFFPFFSGFRFSFFIKSTKRATAVLHWALPLLRARQSREEWVNVYHVAEEAPLSINISLQVKSLLCVKSKILFAVFNKFVAVFGEILHHILVHFFHSFNSCFGLRFGNTCLFKHAFDSFEGLGIDLLGLLPISTLNSILLLPAIFFDFYWGCRVI